ncbi:MAG TPA: DoxX family protein [Desulfobacteraceae bacterium]|nr:DoxX family protein [Desulfobacteraceae bacterium]
MRIDGRIKDGLMRLLSPIPYRLIRVALGGVFLYSGISKSLDLGYFSEVINAFGLLPSALAYPAGVVIVIAELVLGAGIILDHKGALGGLLVMLLGFMAVAGYAILMGYDIDCGCFGPGAPEAEAFSSLRTVIARDAVMVAGIAYLYLWRWKTGCRPRSFLLGSFPSAKGARKLSSKDQHDPA